MLTMLLLLNQECFCYLTKNVVINPACTYSFELSSFYLAMNLFSSKLQRRCYGACVWLKRGIFMTTIIKNRVMHMLAVQRYMHTYIYTCVKALAEDCGGPGHGIFRGPLEI